METIYDVLAFVVSKLRHVATDAEIGQALAVIDQWRSGTAQSQAPADAPGGLPQQGGF